MRTAPTPPPDTVAFIGAGNMAEALVRGLRAAGVVPPEHLAVTDVAPERLAHFRDRYGVGGGTDNAAAARAAGVVVLAVKPQLMAEVCRGLAGALAHDPLILSIAAGVTTARIEGWLGGAARVVRAMPNTPALIGAGVTAISPGRRATAADLDRAERLLGAAGTVVRVEESAMDAVTAVSGSGPAYVFYLAEAMLAAAAREGLAPDVARTLVERTIAGAGRLLAEGGVAPEELRRRVTSKGGTTEAAVTLLEARAVRSAIEAAIAAAAARSRELAGGPAR